MLNDPPEKTVETITRVLLFCERRAALRDFAGYQPGKRRNLAVCDEIAKRIAPRYMYPVEFKDGDRLVTQEELTSMLADVLRSIPDEQAFLMVSKLARHKEEIADMIARRMSKRVKAAFTMRQIDNVAVMLRVNDPTRKSHADEAADYQNRIASLHPRYRWKRTVDIHTFDFTGFDHGTPFARVWYQGSKEPMEAWRWECTATRPRLLNSLPTGGADITRQAARDAEDYYDTLKRLNELSGA